ncbi:MAG: Hsp20/alpha crystallin family protein, partial [Roseiflexaceae bacterium]|nr:Hsp20/alpha crystallin family protein [Roseiflexaceae bacterium]
MQRVILLRRGPIQRDQQLLQQRLERVFQNTWAQASVVAVVARPREAWHPATDVYETDEAFVVRVELAGMRAAPIEITVDEYGLHIRGSRPAPRPAAPRAYHQMGVAAGPFELEVFIGQPFDADQVRAEYD